MKRKWPINIKKGKKKQKTQNSAESEHTLNFLAYVLDVHFEIN